VIKSKIKCDSSSWHYYRTSKQEVEISDAIGEKWWEIEVHPGSIAIRQPKLVDSFNTRAKHACSVECARQIVEEAAKELIPDEVEAKSEASA
jgi:hypothetical protein